MARDIRAAFGFTLTLLLVGSVSPAAAAPLCSDTVVFPVALSAFSSCTVTGPGPGGQDTLVNVQAALDLALEPNILLDATGSFCPGSGCSGTEFSSSSPGDGFIISPMTVAGSDTFTFEDLPPGTLFISLKQGNAFEVFRVPGPTPFDLTHMLGGASTSHISTFAAIPEPSTLSLILGVSVLALSGRAAVRRRARGC